MATNINTILDWFRTGKKPTQTQFWDSWKSFWHKDEIIPQASIENLTSSLDRKANDITTLSLKVDLPSGVNLNDYVETGFYTQNNSLWAQSGFNYPIAQAGKLEVVKTPEIIYQTYHVYGPYNDIYIRSFYISTDWAGWKKISSITNIPIMLGGESLDTALLTGIYRSEIQSGAANPYTPTLIVSSYDTGLQINGGYVSDELNFRGWGSQGFSPWRTVWHDGNFDPALKADYASTLTFKEIIGDYADLNNFTSIGIFHQALNVFAQHGTNYPINVAGMLQVNNLQGYIYQQYYAFGLANDMFIRTFYPENGWSSWKKVLTNSDTLSWEPQIVNDFDAVTGFNLLEAYSEALNRPGAGSWGAGIQFSTNKNPAYINQLVYDVLGGLYTRTKYNEDWGQWQKILTDSDPAFTSKANDSDVLHKTGDESKEGSLTLNNPGIPISTIVNSDGVNINIYFQTGGWARGYTILDQNGVCFTMLGGFGDGQDFHYAFLGKGYNESVIKYTNNRVGINLPGTVTPEYNLDVNGNARFSALLEIQSDTEGAIRFRKTDGTMVGYIGNHDSAFGTSDDDFTIYAYNASKLRLSTGGVDDRLTIDNNGNVGIGKSNPESKLDVDGSITIPSGHNLSWGGNYGDGHSVIAGNDFGIYFYPGGSAVGETVRFQANGKVGIGKTPEYKLDVNGSIRAEGVIVATADITVGGTGSFAGEVTIPEGTVPTSAVNKSQLDNGLLGKADAHSIADKFYALPQPSGSPYDYQILESDFGLSGSCTFFIDASAGDFTVYLPSVVTDGYTIHFFRIDTSGNNVKIVANHLGGWNGNPANEVIYAIGLDKQITAKSFNGIYWHVS